MQGWKNMHWESCIILQNGKYWLFLLMFRKSKGTAISHVCKQIILRNAQFEYGNKSESRERLHILEEDRPPDLIINI